MENVIVVSRHESFINYVCKELGLDKNKIRVYESVTPETIKDKIVITSGLPLHLMAEAREVITVDLQLPRDPNERARALRELEEDSSAYQKYLTGISRYEVKREIIK